MTSTPPITTGKCSDTGLSLSLKWPTSRTCELLLRRAMSWKRYNLKIQNAKWWQSNRTRHIYKSRIYINWSIFSGCQAFKWVPLKRRAHDVLHFPRMVWNAKSCSATVLWFGGSLSRHLKCLDSASDALNFGNRLLSHRARACPGACLYRICRTVGVPTRIIASERSSENDLLATTYDPQYDPKGPSWRIQVRIHRIVHMQAKSTESIQIDHN